MIIRRLTPANRWLEPLLAFLVIAAIAYDIWFIVAIGYVPQPFFYESQDTWMDWFNTALYAHQGGAYEDWRTVYLPLSFDVLKLLTLGQCYESEQFEARACDVMAITSMHVIFLANIVLTFFVFRKVDRSTAVWRTIAMSLGLPLTYALERGNLLLLTYTFLLLAYGPLVKSARVRWLFSGLAINMKIYLVGAIFAQLLKHRWRWFEGSLVATVLVYLGSYAWLGDGSPFQIVRNLVDYSSLEITSPLDAWYAATYVPLTQILELSDFPIISTLGSDVIENFVWGLPLVTHLVQATILCAALATWISPSKVPTHRAIMLSIGLALITTETGGYTQLLLLPFVFMERWRGVGRKWAIVAAYILCIPADIHLQTLGTFVRDSFVSGREVYADYDIALGHFLRPGLFMSIPFALSLVTIREVLLDVRANGLRWRCGPMLTA